MAQLRMPRPNPAARAAACVDTVDTSYLESLLGYNARRAALAVIEVFLERMAPYELSRWTSRCCRWSRTTRASPRASCARTLGILPPNLVGMVNALEKRELIARRPHPRDGRAMGLHLTASGRS